MYDTNNENKSLRAIQAGAELLIAHGEKLKPNMISDQKALLSTSAYAVGGLVTTPPSVPFIVIAKRQKVLGNGMLANFRGLRAPELYPGTAPIMQRVAFSNALVGLVTATCVATSGPAGVLAQRY